LSLEQDLSLEKAPLGKQSEYPDTYSRELLFPIPRRDNRAKLGLEDGEWPGYGEDLWQAWEISWLRPGGLPAVAWARIRIPCDSPNLIESKSFKLYLNSLNQKEFDSESEVRSCIERDVGQYCGAEVTVELVAIDQAMTALGQPSEAIVIDQQAISDVGFEYRPTLLGQEPAPAGVVEEVLCSHLLKSNCPVTGQPDWGSVVVRYRGRPLDREGLLRYIVGFRQHQDFHEHCVETIFQDLIKQCDLEALTVSAHYTRRGGLDINPWRSTEPGSAPAIRLVRQ